MKRNAAALVVALTLVFAVFAVTPSPAKAEAPIGWEINCNSGGLGGFIFVEVVSAKEIGETIMFCHSLGGDASVQAIFAQ
jgi:hypothetical protein